MKPSAVQPLEVFKTVREYKVWRGSVKGTVGFVATLGALHEGHFSLIRRAGELSDNVVVSIFVNPLQFGPKEDFGKYPRTLEADLDHCRKLGVKAVFHPSVEEIYPEGKDACTKVIPPPEIADVLEGSFRPGFFTGVATVVAKLFLIIEPDITVFGEKDYQQLVILKKMVRDLSIPVTLYSMATSRTEDSFALSSRNAYLSEDQRHAAPKIYQALCSTAERIRANPAALEAAVEAGKKELEEDGIIHVQYLTVRDAETFEEVSRFDRKLVLLVAAKIGDVRLIDNIVLQ
jgi:pantoate--beta-alanine ligase